MDTQTYEFTSDEASSIGASLTLLLLMGVIPEKHEAGVRSALAKISPAIAASVPARLPERRAE